MEQITVYSDFAERAVLGALIIHPDIIHELNLRADDFYIERNRLVWQTISGLITRGIDPDFVTLCNSLEKQGRLEDIGGAPFITDLAMSEGIWVHANQYALSVQDYGRRRRAIQAASKLAMLAYDLKADMNTGVSDIVQLLTMDVSTRSGAQPISNFVDELFTEVQELAAHPRGEIWGMPTGFYDYDHMTGGLQDSDGELLLLAGEPNIGKSIFAMQMAFNLAKAGYPGVIYSLEMQARQVLKRTISAYAKFETRKLKTGNISEKEMQSFIAECEKIAGLNLYFSEESYQTTDDLRADIARLKGRYGIRWFLVDYLYLMSDGKGMGENERTTIISANMKKIARNFKVAGIVISSVNKSGFDEQTKSGKASIRGSGQQIHDADVVLFMREHNPPQFEVKNPNMRTLTFEKTREGDEGKRMFDVLKHDGYPYFENVTRKERK